MHYKLATNARYAAAFKTERLTVEILAHAPAETQALFVPMNLLMPKH
jgi:hypothetical protein